MFCLAGEVGGQCFVDSRLDGSAITPGDVAQLLAQVIGQLDVDGDQIVCCGM